LTDKIIAKIVENNIIPYMTDITTEFPDYILPYDGERKIIADITETYRNKINQSKTSGLQP